MTTRIDNETRIKTEVQENGYSIITGNAIDIIKCLEDKSIKLLYGSPPYPNAKRNYRSWKIENYIEEISPFITNALPKLKDDGFIVINVKSNRTNPKSKEYSSERSLIIEELMIYMKKTLKLYCVDIEIWVKSNPVPTGVRVACQDAYEYNIWFSKSPKWSINIDSIRRPYSESTLKTYMTTIYKPRKNGLKYVSKEKEIVPNVNGSLPVNIFKNEIDNLANNLKQISLPTEQINSNCNIIYGAVSGKSQSHQAVQPVYLPTKYILSCTTIGDIVLDPWVGSGTTGIAAIKNQRRFIGIDISEDFTKLALQNINDALVK